MRIWIKVQRAKLALKYRKAVIFKRQAMKEARKLALAVVLLEFLLAGGYAIAEHKGYLEFLQPKTVIIKVAEAKEITPEAPKQPEVVDNSINNIADKIYLLESSRGKNNYSKCKAIGRVNSIGYGIDGSGKFVCFKDHAEEMLTLTNWIKNKQAQGMTEAQMLCLYSGRNYKGCN